VAVSILLWGESPGFFPWLGIALGFIAIALFGVSLANAARVCRKAERFDPLLVALFVAFALRYGRRVRAALRAGRAAGHGIARHHGPGRPREPVPQPRLPRRLELYDTGTASLRESPYSLRKAFADDPHDPHFIQTIAKSGYRLIAPVEHHPHGDSHGALQRDRIGRIPPGRAFFHRWLPSRLCHVRARGLGDPGPA
jgi:hypothetical protein